jgi:hypothetical protein
MNAKIIQSHVETYFQEKGLPPEGIIGIVIEGSIPKGYYVEGWSDLDLVCLCEKPLKEDFSYIENLNNYLIEKTGGLKSGIAILNYKNYIKSCQNAKVASMNARYVKSFLYSYYPLEKRIFYKKPGFEMPTLSKDIEKQMDPSADVIHTVSYAYKFLGETKNWHNKKSITRKLIKMSIAIMVDINYLYEKKFIHNYEEAINFFKKNNIDLDINSLEKWFSKRFIWKEINDGDIADSEIIELQKLFFNLEEKYYDIYNNDKA